jgi:hypothetical protein
MTSTNPDAVRARLRRLHDPAWRDRVNAQHMARYRAKRHRALLAAASDRADMTRLRIAQEPSKALLRRVEHHLSRGRDAGDIAVRENVLLSLAQRAVGLIACPKPKPTHDSTASGDRGRD